jgi:hypothetical protein
MRKIVVTAILCCLLLPGLLAAEPKATSRATSPSVKQVVASWAHNLFKLMAHSILPVPPDPTTDGRCTADPNGGCKP